MSTEPATVTVPVDEHDDVHRLFGLSYCDYYVAPRTLLQSMPEPWQLAFTALMRQLHDAFANVPQAESYEVTAGTEHEAGDLDELALAAAGIEHAEDEDGSRLLSREGEEVRRDELVFVPGTDPVPYYNRGRARVSPDPAALADLVLTRPARG